MCDGWSNENYSNELSCNFRSVLGILFYFISPEWCILLGGFTAGTIAFL